jgi:hypothetical protein
MKEMIRIVPIVLYFLVGIICLIMAKKSILSKKFLPFHEQAVGKFWEEIETSVQQLILTLMKLVGLGFLINAIMLTVFPIIELYFPCVFFRYSIPSIAIIFCIGLSYFNYLLYKRTKAETPWKKSIVATAILIIGVIVSLIN